MYNRQYYNLKLKDKKIVAIRLNGAETDSFRKPATNSRSAKLYMVMHSSKIIYIGFTNQNIRSRLRFGFAAKGKGGYHGYKWKELKEVDLYIWFFPNKKPFEVEAIEAELVYLIRKNTGKWPEYQTEIHFRNPSDEEKQLAEQLYNEISSQILSNLLTDTSNECYKNKILF